MTGLIVGSILVSIFGYLLGSLSFAIILSKYKYNQDIRNLGSGNAGATNMQRQYGWFAAIFVLIFDAFKTYLACWIALIFIKYVPFFHGVNPLFAGFFAVVGHCWPIYFKFRGGKGAASIYGFLCFYNPLIIILAPSLFWLILLSSRYASIASLLSLPVMTAVILILYGIKPDNVVGYPYPQIINDSFSSKDGFITTNILFIGSCCLLYYRHSWNIKNLINGKEAKHNFGKKNNH